MQVIPLAATLFFSHFPCNSNHTPTLCFPFRTNLCSFPSYRSYKRLGPKWMDTEMQLLHWVKEFIKAFDLTKPARETAKPLARLDQEIRSVTEYGVKFCTCKWNQDALFQSIYISLRDLTNVPSLFWEDPATNLVNDWSADQYSWEPVAHQATPHRAWFRENLSVFQWCGSSNPVLSSKWQVSSVCPDQSPAATSQVNCPRQPFDCLGRMCRMLYKSQGTQKYLQ